VGISDLQSKKLFTLSRAVPRANQYNEVSRGIMAIIIVWCSTWNLRLWFHFWTKKSTCVIFRVILHFWAKCCSCRHVTGDGPIPSATF